MSDFTPHKLAQAFRLSPGLDVGGSETFPNEDIDDETEQGVSPLFDLSSLLRSLFPRAQPLFPSFSVYINFRIKAKLSVLGQCQQLRRDSSL